MQEPFIMLPRSFFSTGYWRQSRTFNDCEAVLDIIYQVRFEASETCARIGGRVVTWKQYQWPASIRFLASRWKWTEKKVRVFVSSLRRQGIISTDDTQGVNIITLLDSPFFHYTNGEGTQKDAPLELILSEIQALRAQQGAQTVVDGLPANDKGHTKGTKHKKEKNNKDSSLRSESTLFDMPEEFPFDDFWNLYDKKVAKTDCQKTYAKISLKDRKAIFDYIPKYKQAQPDKQYRKNPLTFLHQRAWEDEIIDRNETTTTHTGYRTETAPSDGQLFGNTYDLINEARASENRDDTF